MAWKKLGQVFCPTGKSSWMKSHAAVPFVEPLGGGLFQVYFNTRDARNRSSIASLKFNIKNPQKTFQLSSKPLLEHGTSGQFDEHGTMISWKTKANGKNYIYYFGWNLAVSVPFRNSIGLAFENPKTKKMTKAFDGPILDRSIYDACFVANPCVLKEGKKWRMWYLSCIQWQKLASGLRHRYHLKYAESSDGVSWNRKGIVAIDFKNKDEYAISRPFVLKEKGIYKMWFSYRGSHYRIGYAESRDGIKWSRKDEKGGLDVSKSGWDSDMVEYPSIFDHQGSRYMIYNGNDYGRTGFGLAVWENGK